MPKDIHYQFMAQAFRLAKKGTNRVFPNPFVGALVVKNGRIVAKGFHAYSGGPHAEVAALNQCSGAQTKGADLYVTLEPCSTWGRTPPCTESIIRSKIKRVFFGAYDSNHLNRRKAEKVLHQNGIETRFLNFQEQNDALNRVFIHTCQCSTRPYIHLKAAVTLDGKIADREGKSQWITSEKSRKEAHRLRGQSDAIMVGSSTFNKDNPRLNIRYGIKDFKDPAKIILSASGNIDYNHFLLRSDTKSDVFLFTGKEGAEKAKANANNRNLHLVPLPVHDKTLSLKECLGYIRERGYYSLLVEGGGVLIGQFLRESLFDELHFFMAPRIFGRFSKSFYGSESLSLVNEDLSFEFDELKILENDIYLRYRHVYRNH